MFSSWCSWPNEMDVSRVQQAAVVKGPTPTACATFTIGGCLITATATKNLLLHKEVVSLPLPFDLFEGHKSTTKLVVSLDLHHL